MFAWFVKFDGEWEFFRTEEHESCSVQFIDMIDKKLGDGSAYVVKLPALTATDQPLPDPEDIDLDAELAKLMHNGPSH